MDKRNLILKYLSNNSGQITNEDAKNLKISTGTLRNMYADGELEKLSRGVYIDPLIFGDDMAALQYRFPKGIYFRDTALFLHGMIDGTPATYEMNFPVPYSYSNLKDATLRIHRQNIDLYHLGIVEIDSPGGHKVKTYSMERTICDILRKRDRSDAETIKQAMNNYVQMKDRNISKLMEYAMIFKVEKDVRTYLEILL